MIYQSDFRVTRQGRECSHRFESIIRLTEDQPQGAAGIAGRPGLLRPTTERQDCCSSMRTCKRYRRAGWSVDPLLGCCAGTQELILTYPHILPRVLRCCVTLHTATHRGKTRQSCSNSFYPPATVFLYGLSQVALLLFCCRCYDTARRLADVAARTAVRTRMYSFVECPLWRCSNS